MTDGFIKVAAGTLHPGVADVRRNGKEICDRITDADKAGVQILVLPELCITGYTCGDLFASRVLQQEAKDTLKTILAHTKGLYPIVTVGLPFLFREKLYNVTAVIRDGKLLGMVPKTNLPNYGEFYEKRQFFGADCLAEGTVISFAGQQVPFGNDLIFCHEEAEDYRFGVEICEDAWGPVTPAENLCLNGALLILNSSASTEIMGKADYRRSLIQVTSSKLCCGYVYANAGPEESTTDVVFSRHHLICEKGTVLAENKPFEDNALTISEIDCQILSHERQRLGTFAGGKPCRFIPFDQPLKSVALTRFIPKNPFIPCTGDAMEQRGETALQIQAYGLKKRLEAAHSATAVIGISGGLDSCLALLVTVKAMDMLHRDRKDIVAVTMPCFGTSERTHTNARILCDCLGVTLREVSIARAVSQHFSDIGHNPEKHDVTYENSQARERTQVIMDIANELNGLVVGTGDLSELALGWATYNGDHMSMYGVNASVSKTLVRYLVHRMAQQSEPTLRGVLEDILATPVSPELLPVGKDGAIAQVTEDLVGPYELHDFFLYYTLRWGFSPQKIRRLAQYAFAGDYADEVICRWLGVFFRRFFTQQFKRSCLPDGPKVGSVGLSPRGDWRMPSDTVGDLWLKGCEK